MRFSALVFSTCRVSSSSNASSCGCINISFIYLFIFSLLPCVLLIQREIRAAVYIFLFVSFSFLRFFRAFVFPTCRVSSSSQPSSAAWILYVFLIQYIFTTTPPHTPHYIFLLLPTPYHTHTCLQHAVAALHSAHQESSSTYTNKYPLPHLQHDVAALHLAHLPQLCYCKR